jgi:AbrB family looped-hinge helix DNA binding protein
MKTTIDKAGRVVIPSLIRRRAGLRPGEPLDIVVDDDSSVRLVRRVEGPRLVKVRNRLRAQPTVPSSKREPVDLAALVEEERSRWPW